MKQIDVSTPKHPKAIAMVDEEDFERINRWKWVAVRDPKKKTLYAIRTDRMSGKKTVRMHREILGLLPGEQADHRDGNGLNNTRANLRRCSGSQNACNRGPTAANKSGFRGVSWHKGVGKWVATIGKNRRHKHLGYFEDPAEAARVRDAAALRLHGEFAKLNFPGDR